MDDSNFLSIVAGLVAYCFAILLGTGPLVFLAYSLDKWLTKNVDEDKLMSQDNRSVAIELGTTILCQAILIRHAVYAFMAIIRSLFVEELPGGEIFWLLARSVMFILIIIGLALGSVHIAGTLFKKCMKKFNVDIDEGIRSKNNIAMAIFYALVLLAITLVLNEGMEDFSRSLIPYGRGGGLVSLE